MTAISGLLQNIPLLCRLTMKQLDAVADICQRDICQPDQILIKAGDPVAAAIYFIDGHVECLTTEPSGLQQATRIPTGSTLLELAMIVEMEATTTCVTRSTCKLLKIPRNAMHDILQRDAALTDAVLEALTIRLREMADTMREVSLDFDPDIKRSA